MKIKTRILLYAGIIIAYFAYKIFMNLEVFKQVIVVPGKSCQVILAPKGGEDIALFNGTLIFGGDDRIRLWHTSDGGQATPNGQLFAIEENMNQVYEVPLLDFPDNIAFHPHGIYLRENRLFVINHAYGRGGERVEIFQLAHTAATPTSLLTARYLESFVFGGHLNGVFNDLVVISDDEFYMTRWLVFPHGLSGRGQDLTSQFKFILPGLFEMKSTHIYYCKREQCRPTTAPAAQMYNGIDWDGKQRLFASSTTDRQVYELTMDPKDPANLTVTRTFKFANNLDNVFFDAERNELTVASIGKVSQFLMFERAAKRNVKVRPKNAEFYTGYEVVDLETGVVSTRLMQKDLIYGISSARRHNGKIYLGTFADDRIVVCKD